MNTPTPNPFDARIEVLMRRWRLPEARRADVQRLLEAEASGETAVTVEASVPGDWGEAACVATEPAAPPPQPPRPLVLTRIGSRTWLQSWSAFTAERTVSLALRALAEAPERAVSGDLLAKLSGDRVNEGQLQAIRCALGRRLALITGGPGTGKTHTLARHLALELASASPAPRVALAAPTGKAAERMREAIEQAAAQLPEALSGQAPALREVALETSTLHRLLGYNPGNGTCARTAAQPLDCAILIVDEVSMVDTFLWKAMLEALPAGAKLVLLGDPNQLESVAPGDVLASLVRGLRADPGSPLRAVHVELTESHRFRNRPDIGALARAVVTHDAASALRLLAGNAVGAAGSGTGGLTWLGPHDGRFSWDRLPASVQDALLRIAEAPSPAQALAALARVRVLTAHRDAPMGAAGLNLAIRQEIAARMGGRPFAEPVIINRNDPETGLKNGSVGILVQAAGTLTAFFPAQQQGQEPVAFPPIRLPDHGPAWAMTIHRSQGSEFEEIVVVLPEAASPLATRELVYTGITRARSSVHVWGSEETLREAVSDRSIRATLLRV